MGEPLNSPLNRVSFQLTVQHHDPSRALERLEKFWVLVCLGTRECAIIRFESGFWVVERGEQQIEFFDGVIVTPGSEVFEGAPDVFRLKGQIIIPALWVAGRIDPGMRTRLFKNSSGVFIGFH